MCERGEWFVCLVREAAVSTLYSQVAESCASTMYVKKAPWRPGVEKVVVRWDHPVTVEYVRRVLTAAEAVRQWSKEWEYQASFATRVETIEKLKKEYTRRYSKYNKDHPHFRVTTHFM